MKMKNKQILLVVTGGIASYKCLDLMRLLISKKYDVECVLSKNVEKFVSPLTYSSLIGKKVYTDLFSSHESNEMGHINLAKNADLILVVPATANFIGKVANGIGDDLASTIMLATRSPIFFAPAMNTFMLENKAVKHNIKVLKKRGITFLDTSSGKLACGEIGKGKLLPIELILERIEAHFNESKLLEGKKAVVTSGPSIENIDPIRCITNLSSGLQGYHIARELQNAGATTTLISGPTNIKPPENVDIRNVKTGEDFLEESLALLPADIYISVAAISDFKIKSYKSSKIKKNKNYVPKIELIQNTDVLKRISLSNKRPKLVIGFAAETENLVKNANEKLTKKKCDWILGNLISSEEGFGDKSNNITFFKNGYKKKWPQLRKSMIARRLVLEISNHFNNISKVK